MSTGETLRPRTGTSGASPKPDFKGEPLKATTSPSGASSKMDFDAARKSAATLKPVGNGSGIGKKLGIGAAAATGAATGLGVGIPSATNAPKTDTSGSDAAEVRRGKGLMNRPSTSSIAPKATTQAKPEQTTRWGGSGGVRSQSGLSAKERVGGPNASAKATQAYSNYADKRDAAKREVSGKRPSWAEKAFQGN
jgi:hypothetical protein